MCDKELLAVTVLFRHGDRMPALFYPNDPHKNSPIWTAAPGDLTNLGKRRMYELGQWFRRRYDGFLSKTYERNEIYVLSSDRDRSIASASAILAGLYPPVEQDIWHPHVPWQPIPVHTIPKKYDRMLYYYENQQFIEYMFQFIKPMNEKNKSFYEYLSDHCGQTIGNTMDANFLGDTLDIEEMHNLTLPEWTRGDCRQKLNDIRKEIMCGMNNTQEFNKIATGLFFNEVLKQFQSYSLQHQTIVNVPKMKIFSAHDMNIHVVLQALDIPHSTVIPYGASIIFELRRSKLGQLFVELVYKTDKVEVMEIKKNCAQCSYEEFVTIVKPMCIDEDLFDHSVLQL